MIGIVQILLPYMVLTLYTSLSGIDRGLLTAAQSLAPGVSVPFGRCIYRFRSLAF